MVEKKNLKESRIYTLPNFLTMIRILLIPIFVYYMFDGRKDHSIIAAAIFIVASITDYLDGLLARTRGDTTTMGKFLDPLADKLIVMSALVMLVQLNRIAGWIVIILLAREMAVNGLRSMASQRGIVIPAGFMGKAKTFVQFFAISGLIIHYPAPVGFGDFVITLDFQNAGMLLIYVALILSVISGALYFKKFAKTLM